MTITHISERELALERENERYKQVVRIQSATIEAQQESIISLMDDAERWKKVSMQRSDFHGDCYVMVFAENGDYPPKAHELNALVDAMKESK